MSENNTTTLVIVWACGCGYLFPVQGGSHWRRRYRIVSLTVHRQLFCVF